MTEIITKREFLLGSCACELTIYGGRHCQYEIRR